MGFKKVSLDFDNISTYGYYSGTSFTGRAKFVLDKPIKVKHITLYFEGIAKVFFRTNQVIWFHFCNNPKQGDIPLSFGNIFDVQWNTIGWQRSLKNTNFLSEELFLKVEHQLSGEACLKTGVVSFPFKFDLPDYIPSSFQGSHGGIRYKIKLKWTTDGFFSFSDIYKVDIPILNTNLLEYSELWQPKTYYRVSEPFRIFTPTDPIKIMIKVPKSAVRRDEVINIDIEINNASTNNITTTFVKFVQRTVWLGESPFYKNIMMEDKILEEFSYDGVPPQTFKSWTQPFKVTAGPLVCIEACTIIKIFHLIMVEVVVSGSFFSHKRNVVAPIKIFPDCSKEPSDLPKYTPASDPSESNFREDDPPPPYPGLPQI